MLDSSTARLIPESMGRLRIHNFFLLALTTAAACSDVACTTEPCPLAVAVIVDVKSTLTGSRVPGAYIRMVGSSSEQPCDVGETTVCRIFGAPGKYDFEVGAPGLLQIRTTAMFVAARQSGCGCENGTPAAVDITLFNAPPPSS
jgi:hypothetical protein